MVKAKDRAVQSSDTHCIRAVDSDISSEQFTNNIHVAGERSGMEYTKTGLRENNTRQLEVLLS
jgi:hypothetical protein